MKISNSCVINQLECSDESAGRRDFDILFFLICFIPYVSFFVIRGADVQPLFLLVGVVYFISGYCYRHWRLDQYEWRLLTAALLFFIYMNWFGNDNSLTLIIRKNTSLLFGWLILICARRSRSMPTWVLVFLPGMYLVAALIQLVFPSLYNHMMVFMMNEIRTQSTRGVTGLCPEPSFLSMIGICFLAILAVIKREEWQYYFLGMLLAVVSRSATGIGFLIIFMAFCLISQRRSFVRMIVLFPLVIACTWAGYRIATFPLFSNPAIQSVEKTSFSTKDTNPKLHSDQDLEGKRAATKQYMEYGEKQHRDADKGIDLKTTWNNESSSSSVNKTATGFSSESSRWAIFSKEIYGVIYDPSCLPRLISFSSGIATLPVHPLGTGEMFSPDTALISSRKIGLTDLWAEGMSEMKHSPYLIKFMSENEISDRKIASTMLIESLISESGYINALASHFQRMGFVFVVIIGIVFSAPNFWTRKNWPVVALALMGWGFSTPLVFPPFWYLLGQILGRPEKRSCL